MKKFHRNSGLSILGLLFLGGALVLVLGYFNISIKSIAENPTTQSNFSYMIKHSKNIWNNYLERPTAYIWGLFISSLKKIQSQDSEAS